jgi:dihydroorotase
MAMKATLRVRMRRPDDWHVHFRDDAILRAVAPLTARQFGRALVMPNLVPPVCTVAQARAYRERILATVRAADPANSFEPYLALYLTERTSVETVQQAKESGFVLAFKWYPAGATTNAEQGVRSIERLNAVLAAMETLGVVLCVHGESTDPAVDVYDREEHFIRHELEPVRKRFPRLRIVVEHVSTAFAAKWVLDNANGYTAATVTVQHLLCNRNDLLVGGLKPHLYCLPVLKSEQDRLAIIEAIRQDNRGCFFLGTDSAPHPRFRKESACASAGCFTAIAAMELYAEAFAKAGMLDRLERFAAENGARFYGLQPSTEYVQVLNWPEAVRTIPEYVLVDSVAEREPQRTPETRTESMLTSTTLQPFQAGARLMWSMERLGISDADR